MGTKVYNSYKDQTGGSSPLYVREWVEYTTSANDNSFVISFLSGIQQKNTVPLKYQYTHSIYHTIVVPGNTSGETQFNSGNKSVKFGVAGTTNLITSSTSPRSITYTKQKTARTIQVKLYHSGYAAPGDPWNVVSITIPAKKSYTVAYNANGGINAPASQTKWYGESLTLQKSVPSKIDSTSGLLYDFIGWNTSADGTGTMYQPGAAYTGNDKLTLYAQWAHHYYPPVIKHYDVTRCDQNGNPEDEGEYAKVTFDCVINRWKHSGNTTLSAASVSIGSHTATPTITYSTDGYDTVCTCSAIVGDGSFSADATYTGSISVTDSSTGETMSTATANIVLNSAKFAIDMSANGRSIGIFKPASDTEDYLLDVGGKIQADDSVVIKTNSDSTTHPSSALYPKLIEVQDVNGLPIGYVEGALSTDGKNGVSLTAKKMVSDVAKYNYLRLLVDDSGNPVVQVGDAAAWRTGLGLGGLATKSSVAPTTVAKTFSKVHSSAQASGNVFTVSITCKADAGYKPIAVTGVYCNGTGTGAVYLRGFNVNGYDYGPTAFTVDTYWRASGSVSANAMTAYVEILTMKTALS